MLLAIDAGNTNVVFAVFGKDGRLRQQWRLTTQASRTHDAYAVWLQGALAMVGLQLSDMRDGVLASVVPPATDELERLCRAYLGCNPLVAGRSGVDHGIPVRVEAPDEVGPDRLVNALGVHLYYGGPRIVVDFGTATTFDVIGADGAYCGGAIAPGVNLSQEALQGAAAKLPHVQLTRPERVRGGTTVGAMRSGLYYGYMGLVDGLVARLRADYGSSLPALATGGLGGLFAPASETLEGYDPNLILYGLQALYTRNRGRLAASARNEEFG